MKRFTNLKKKNNKVGYTINIYKVYSINKILEITELKSE